MLSSPSAMIVGTGERTLNVLGYKKPTLPLPSLFSLLHADGGVRGSDGDRSLTFAFKY